MREELLKGLSEEQIEKARACKNQEELLAAAKEEGLELTDEQLEAIAGGGACNAGGGGVSITINRPDAPSGPRCPFCGSTNIHPEEISNGEAYVMVNCCGNCGMMSNIK